MKLSGFSAVYLTIWCLSARRTLSQSNTVLDDTNAVSSGIDEFAIELLAKTAVEGGDQLNIVMSTYSIWNLLAILTEGAASSTANQLRTALRIPSDNNRFKFGYKNINRVLTTNTSGVDINLANAIFSDKNRPVNKMFEYQTSSQYNVNFLPVDFSNKQQAVEYIDSYIAKATNNRVKHFINFEDLNQAQLLLTTAIFFKGDWTIPFNRSATQPEIFYDENRKPIGRVQLMYQNDTRFAYSRFDNLQAHAIGLPYGPDEKYMFIAMLPWDGIRLIDFLNTLTRTSFKSIMAKLEEDKDIYEEDEIRVFLPKFKITSDFVLNVILEKMGIIDVFDPYYSNLRKISNDNFFLSRVIHKAEIEVNEEGTVASAVTGGYLVNKQQTPEFKANRPFVYFIVERSTNTILFAGKLSNPNDLN